ncbi:Predicted homoserine dehydrogenase, contains C-terminal SAF domain [Cohaesibacter sp. ES.047]|uniref:NAD(P)H-dependent oxidoreductase n=1 Tax=Cohaesibacter sp. ES.047 TaxID=1798205 RepID=UPI000BB848C7|nr:flagellar biosynthesis protein FlgA [Cohaesibacter sp. ES.047]SNY91631.1 Predicted homoserine dehydrogenase, contains C-terminal SAF domain [Cohaesibacter sp. ES.047]
MNYHSYFKADSKIVEACIIGTGGFGRSLLAQGLRVPLLEVRIGVDVTAQNVVEAMIDAGVDEAQIAVCHTAQSAKEAFEKGAFIATDDLAHVVDLPFSIAVEATGHPVHGARHADLAIRAGKHVAMVSKEVDSVVGAELSARAKEAGLVFTPVDGDQPSLLIGLITWAQLLGLEIIAAGKASEYDFVYDRASGTIACNGSTYETPQFAPVARMGDSDIPALVESRAKAASALPQRAVPDLCEMSIVANACAMDIDRSDFHCPIARIDEVPSILCGVEDGGILSKTGVLDVFHCLREPGEISFAGGVFVIVRCEHADTWSMLADKGHIISRNARTAMLFLPRHLLGLEAATSLLEAGLLDRSSGAMEPKHCFDLVAFADIDLAEGTCLEMGGHHHSINGVSARLVPAGALSGNSPAPFYLASNQRLARAVKAGGYIVMDDLEPFDPTPLTEIRQDQDIRFHSQGRSS